MKIILDFDDVIFNTRRFTEDYKKIFIRHGVPAAQFDYPRQRNRDGKIKTYNLERHLGLVEKKSEVDIKKLKNGIAEFIKRGRKYVFRDAVQFLGKFSHRQFYLLSRADDEQWQADKIKNSGIGRYFKKIIICAGSKSDSICPMLKKEGAGRKEKIFFIDDRVEHLEDVKKRHPKIVTILLRRKEGRYSDKKNKWCDYEVRGLSEAKEIIRKMTI